MTTIAIFPIPTPEGTPTFCAIAGKHQSNGSTAGQALDALNAKLPPAGANTVVILQHLRPDDLFSAAQQQRLGQLMDAWRSARDQGLAMDQREFAEMQTLIDAEFAAAGERARRVAQQSSE